MQDPMTPDRSVALVAQPLTSLDCRAHRDRRSIPCKATQINKFRAESPISETARERHLAVASVAMPAARGCGTATADQPGEVQGTAEPLAVYYK